MRKICFLIDSLETGGAEKSLLEIASRFQKYTPVFIQLFPGDSLKEKFLEKNIQVMSLNLTPSYNFKEISKFIKPIILKIDPVIIHSTLFRSDMVARHLKKEFNIPLINSLVNNSYSKQRYVQADLLSKLKLYIIQKWDGITAKNVDLFISNSEAIKGTNSKALGIPSKYIKVIYRGRSKVQYQQLDSKDRKALRENFLGRNKKIFLNVSRLLDRKGQIDLLKAFKKLNFEFPETILLIAGEGPHRQILEKKINDLQLNSSVQLLGNRDDVPALLQMADFFVFPSYYEGLPGALIEAMFAKIPIIASEIPENMECINSNNALLFSVGQIDQLLRWMKDALNITDWSLKIEDAYLFALENFEIEKVSALYETTYDELLDKKF